ncbi:aspartic peptidase domain-containing protein [Tricladium varicosporioides]|nr:aspartic peptidase domain-containing protein [Hymenoscyphus varicosporioides]
MFSWKPSVFTVLQLLSLPPGLLVAAATSVNSIRAVPSPLVVPPSGQWDGSDGPWSSFTLSIGTPPQNARVLASTASNQPWVVLPQGCFSDDPSDCGNIRGGAFQPNKSTSWYVPTWIKNDKTANGVFTVTIESNLGLTASAQYGYDNMSLSAGGGMPSLNDQVIGGLAAKDFSMGVLGLNPAATSFSGFNDPIPSYMSSLKNQSVIPSQSYGYTAGAQYRFNKVLASLTLGGYDAALFEPNSLVTTFNGSSNSDLTINVNKIAMNTNVANTTLSATPFSAFIDSTVPYLYLPLQVCQAFEKAFGITYDTKSGLYLVSDTQHTQMVAQNANVTFTLTNSTAKSMVDIVFPYQAFDLTAKWPLVTNTSRYFPLKRAVNSSQITLGRAFLQEAYLIADYERSTFTISQRKWIQNPTPKIQSIPPAGPPGTQESPKPNVAVIVAGVVGGFIIISLIIGVIMIIRRKKNKAKAQAEKTNSALPFSKEEHWDHRSVSEASRAPSTIHQFDVPSSTNSMAEFEFHNGPHARPTSSIYPQTEYDPSDRQSSLPAIPNNFHYSVVAPPAGEAASYYSQGDQNVSAMDLPLGSRGPNGDELVVPPASLFVKKSPVQPAGEFLIELPARENVGHWKFSKKPKWI